MQSKLTERGQCIDRDERMSIAITRDLGLKKGVEHFGTESSLTQPTHEGSDVGALPRRSQVNGCDLAGLNRD